MEKNGTIGTNILWSRKRKENWYNSKEHRLKRVTSTKMCTQVYMNFKTGKDLTLNKTTFKTETEELNTTSCCIDPCIPDWSMLGSCW